MDNTFMKEKLLPGLTGFRTTRPLGPFLERPGKLTGPVSNFPLFVSVKITTKASCSLDNAEFGQFTLLFCRGRQRNEPRIITREHSQPLFTYVPVALSSWFSSTPY